MHSLDEGKSPRRILGGAICRQFRRVDRSPRALFFETHRLLSTSSSDFMFVSGDRAVARTERRQTCAVSNRLESEKANCDCLRVRQAH